MISPELCSALRVTHPCECHFRYFEINGQLVRLGSPAREILDSLGSFFYPYIKSHDEAYAADRFYELTAIIDPTLFNTLKANLSDSPDDLLTTTLKHDLEYQLRCFFSESGEITIIQDERLMLFYIIFDGRTTIVGTQASRMRTGLLRVIRGAWMNAHDAPIVHSCVLEKNGRGVVIAGDKYAGKTTSLLKLCTQKHYGIIANDRCLIQLESRGLVARGVPTIMNLRPETIKPFPDLHYLKTVDVFGPNDLARELRVDIKSQVDVTTIVFLSYDRACRQPAYRPLSDEERCKMLSSHLLSHREYEWVNMMKIGQVLSKSGNHGLSLSGVSAFHIISNENQLDERAHLIDSWCLAGYHRATEGI